MNAKFKKYIKWVLMLLLMILVILQFFPIDKSAPEYDSSNDFIMMHNPPEEVSGILKSACYDCHSFNTRYPWYSNIAPVSFWLKDHIDEARDELNFSEWGTFELRRKDHKLEEVVEKVGEGEMPLKSYLITHSDARLSAEQEKLLLDWIKEVRTSLGYIPEEGGAQSTALSTDEDGEEGEHDEGEEDIESEEHDEGEEH